MNENTSPFDPPYDHRPPIDKHCESCRWFRQRRADDIKVEAGYDHARHWCGHKDIDIPTLPAALRCGGDNWEAIPTPAERQNAADAIGINLDKFRTRHGDWATTEWLVGELVKIQRSSTVDKADYEGDNFKVSVKVKRRR